MATYKFETSATIETGYTHFVEANSEEEALAKFEAGDIEDSYESGVSDTVKQQLETMEAPDGTLTVFGPE